MPDNTQHACQVCGKAFWGDGYFCPIHKADQRDARRAYDRKRFTDDEYHRFLNGQPWRRTTAMVRNQNVQCQVTENGQQCMNLSTETHHILDGREYPALRLDWRNLVAVCGKHHPNSPGDMDRYDYVPTKQTVYGQVTEYAHPSRRPAAPAQPVGPPPAAIIPVADEHAGYPDGQKAVRNGSLYRKQGAEWILDTA